MSRRLVVRADARRNSGAGHVMRMVALAQQWRDVGGNVCFVSQIDSQWLSNRIRQEGFELVAPEGEHPDPGDVRGLLALAGCTDCIAVDGYGFDYDYMKSLRGAGCFTVVMDDVGNRGRYSASVLVNQNEDSLAREYDCDSDTVLLRGARYALIRKELLEYDRTVRCVAGAPQVLITFGGSDPDNRTGAVLERLAEMGRKDLKAKVVVGPLNPHFQILEAMASSLPFECDLLRDVDNMAWLMDWANLMIGAAGSTCWELCYFGVPMLLSSIADNQAGIVESLIAKGAAKSFDGMNSTDLVRLLDDSGKREKMSLAGQMLVDGSGGRRLVKRVLDMLEQSDADRTGVFGTADNLFHDMIFRPVNMDDWEVLLTWRNHVGIRRNSFSTDIISPDNHRSWLRGKLMESGSLFLMAEAHGRPLGQIRFDSIDGEIVVSVSVAPDQFGNGIGTRIISEGSEIARAKFPGMMIVAMVRPENVASARAFTKAGFVASDRAANDDFGSLRFELRK